MTTALLVDADIVAYQFASAAQRTYAFGVAVDELSEVTPLVDAWVAKLEADLDGKAIICLSCPSAEGWRIKVLPTYKANRKDVVRPELLQPVKDYLEATYPSYRRPTLEADDIMGILSTMQGLPRNFVAEHSRFANVERKVIVSEDKDLKTIPGWLYNPAKDRKPRLISEAEADLWHLWQTIVGDTTDGYEGCPGAGPKAAGEVLTEGLHWETFTHTFKSGPRKGMEEARWRPAERPSDALWDRVVALYSKHGYTEEDALVQARVARICRASDYDFKNKEVVLWTPQPRRS